MSNTSEVHTATVLFTDVVGSTALRTRLGEEAAERVRIEHDSIVRVAIEAERGIVVKTLGDGLMATFTAAADAVGAAVRVQQAVERHNRRTVDERVAVRVGISVGDVTFEAGDCFGMPVVEAQRLESHAQPGQILCSELVMHLARGRGGHEFTPIGAIELKGLPAPLPTCEIRWQSELDRRGPDPELPPSLRDPNSFPFAGRAEQLAQLSEIWRRVAAGAFEIVLVAGEPGIGKTRLVTELAMDARGNGGRLLAGRCDEHIRVPYGPFVGALEWSINASTADTLVDSLGSRPGELAVLTPRLTQALPDLPQPTHADPETERNRLFDAIVGWLGSGGDASPTMLVLDDLHWADRCTILLVRHVAMVAPPGLLVVATYRDTDLVRTHPLSDALADLRRLPSVTRLSLDGLDRDGVRELVERTSGHVLDERAVAFAHAVSDETAGNPLFVTEVLRHLAESRVLVQRDGHWTSDLTLDRMTIPEGLREVIGRRLSQLDPETDVALRVAAVIGLEFDLRVLAAVTGATDDTVLSRIEEAAGKALVTEVHANRFRFAHALVRDTLLHELTASRRSREHRRVAEAIEALHPDPTPVLSELAMHWCEAGVGADPSIAISWAARAGEHDLERRAPDQAAAWFTQALELIDDHDPESTERPRLELLLALAYQHGLDRRCGQLSRDVARRALARGDVETAVAALSLTTRTAFNAAQRPDPEKIELLEQTLELVQHDPVFRGRVLSILSVELVFVRQFDRRRDIMHELDETLPLIPDPLDQWRCIVAGTRSLAPGRIELVRRILTDVLPRLSDGFDRFQARQLLYLIHHALGRRDDCERVGAEMIADGVDNRHWFVEFMPAVIDGRVADAERQLQDMLDYMTRVRQDPIEVGTYHFVGLFSIARERGDVTPALELVGDRDLLERGWTVLRAAGAICRLLLGRHHEISLDGAEPEDFPDDAGWPLQVAWTAEIAAAIGSDDLARRLRSIVEPNLGFHVVTGGMYAGAYSRLAALLSARLGDHERADDLFAQAIAEHESFRATAWVARARLDWAEMLFGRGRFGEAAEHVAAARAAIGELELTDNRQRADRLDARLRAARS